MIFSQKQVPPYLTSPLATPPGFLAFLDPWSPGLRSLAGKQTNQQATTKPTPAWLDRAPRWPPSPLAAARPPVCSTPARAAGPGGSAARAVRLVPSGPCAGPDEGLGARIVQPPERTPGPGCVGEGVSEGRGTSARWSLGPLLSRTQMFRPQNQPLHQAPSTRLSRGTVSRDTVTTGRSAPALLLLWRRGSPRILAPWRWLSQTHAHPGAAALETEGVKPESLGRRSEPRRSGPSSLHP